MGHRENNVTSEGHNPQSLADNMKELCDLISLHGYTVEQAMMQMELAPWEPGRPQLSTCQMWVQTWLVVNCNWAAFRAAANRKGGALVGSSFYQSMAAKGLPQNFMMMLLDEVRIPCFGPACTLPQ